MMTVYLLLVCRKQTDIHDIPSGGLGHDVPTRRLQEHRITDVMFHLDITGT